MKADPKQNDLKTKQSKDCKKAEKKLPNQIVTLPQKGKNANLIMTIPPRPFSKE